MNDDSIQRYEQMLMEDPQSRAFAPLAEAHRKAGRLDDAINVAKAGLEIHPDYSGGLVVLGRAFYEKGELDNAAEILKKAVSETPESYLGQKFLGKVFIDKGERTGALKALEAANLLSPEDEEVVRLLDEVKSKATPPETMEFSENEAESDVKPQIVTYEQKPTTVDGVELVPLPTANIDDAFSFSGGGTTDPADITRIIEVEELDTSDIAGEDMAATVIEEVEVEQAMDIESLEELGPEAAAFIQEGEQVMEDSVEGLTDETVVEEGDMLEEMVIEPGGVGFPPGDPPVADMAAEVAGALDQPMPEPFPVTESPPLRETDLESYIMDVSPEVEGLGKGVVLPVMEPAAAPTPGKESEVETGMEQVAPTAPAMEPSTASTDAEVMVEKMVDVPIPAPGHEFQSMASAPPEPPSPNAAREEQFSTETLADLYAQQGLIEKATNIYQQILDQTPDNDMVRLKLEALKAQMPSDAGTLQEIPSPENAQAESPLKDSNEDTLRVLENWLGNVERIKRP